VKPHNKTMCEFPVPEPRETWDDVLKSLGSFLSMFYCEAVCWKGLRWL